MYHFTVYNMLS